MSWVKLDDQFFRHPKAVEAGRDGRDLYLAGLCYCASGLTDGVIPIRALRILAADAEIDVADAAASRLLEVGLWEQTVNGYFVHDYHDYNPTRERVQATREARAEAGSRGGKQKYSNLLEAGQDVASEMLKQNATPYPSRTPTRPVNDQDEDGAKALAADAATDRAAPKPISDPAGFAEFWSAYPKGHGSRKTTADLWRRLKPDKRLQAEILVGLETWKASRRWKDGFVKDAERWFRDRLWENPPEDEPMNGVANGKSPPDALDLAKYRDGGYLKVKGRPL